MQNSWIVSHSYDKNHKENPKKSKIKPATNSCWTKFHKPVEKLLALRISYLWCISVDLNEMMQCFKIAEYKCELFFIVVYILFNAFSSVIISCKCAVYCTHLYTIMHDKNVMQ